MRKSKTQEIFEKKIEEDLVRTEDKTNQIQVTISENIDKNEK